MLPYIPFATSDPTLKNMILGLINRQTYNILLDPYANAYYKDTSNESPFLGDNTYSVGTYLNEKISFF